MNRLPDWQSRLQKIIDDYEAVPFEYGSFDCAIFAGLIVHAQTGDDFHSQFVGKYKTKIGGFRHFKKVTGFRSHIEFIQRKFKEVPAPFAQVGNIGIIKTSEGPAIVIIAGQFCIGLNEAGLVRLPIEEVKKCFRVEGV